MSKILFFIAVAIIVYLLLRVRRPARGEAAPDAPPSPEAMVECAYCGLHVPLSESLEAAGRRYCCDDHRRRDGDR